MGRKETIRSSCEITYNEKFKNNSLRKWEICFLALRIKTGRNRGNSYGSLALFKTNKIHLPALYLYLLANSLSLQSSLVELVSCFLTLAQRHTCFSLFTDVITVALYLFLAKNLISLKCLSMRRSFKCLHQHSQQLWKQPKWRYVDAELLGECKERGEQRSWREKKQTPRSSQVLIMLVCSLEVGNYSSNSTGNRKSLSGLFIFFRENKCRIKLGWLDVQCFFLYTHCLSL